jgi:hypothetical protein
VGTIDQKPEAPTNNIYKTIEPRTEADGKWEDIHTKLSTYAAKKA